MRGAARVLLGFALAAGAAWGAVRAAIWIGHPRFYRSPRFRPGGQR